MAHLLMLAALWLWFTLRPFMPIFTATARQQMLDALDETPAAPAAGIGFLSLHTAYSTTGTNEATGGSPAYARKAAVWSAAAAGQKALSAAVTFDVAAGTYRWVGFWSAVTAGTFFGMTPLNAGPLKPFVTDDVATDTLKSVAHGFANGDQVVAWAGNNTLPTDGSGNLAEGTIYFVVSSATDNLQLSLTSGGAAINFTGKGQGFLQKIVPEVFAAQGQEQVSTLTLDLGVA
jgi:hypothetical protein